MFHSYKLFKVQNGFLHYCVVSVDIEKIISNKNNVDFTDVVLDVDDYTLSGQYLSTDNQSLKPVLEGIEIALSYFSKNFSSQHFVRVKIKHIVNLIKDTHDGDLLAAAIAVMWKALGMEISNLRFVFLPDNTTRVILPDNTEDITQQYTNSNLIISASEAGTYTTN
jgi:hypothetical protein